MPEALTIGCRGNSCLRQTDFRFHHLPRWVMVDFRAWSNTSMDRFRGIYHI
jgi:hypothetical protein